MWWDSGTPASGYQRTADQEIEFDGRLYSVNGLRSAPQSGLIRPEQFETGATESVAEQRLVFEKTRVESEVSVGRVRGG